MSYTFSKGKMYRMPTHFGPSTGPRQGPDGLEFTCKNNPKSINYAVSFSTNRDQLRQLCPPGFEVDGDPVVTVAQTYMKEIEWLAGRGYNTLGVTFNAVFNGKQDRAYGPFLTVLWENLTDPILTGREELGFSKIYCQLPEPVICRGATEITASWLGFRFMDMKLTDMKEVAPEDFPPPAAPRSDGLSGILHYKYMPKTGEWGEADAAYAVLTPADVPNRVVKKMWRGKGTVEFRKTRWEDMPTQFMIPNTFRALEVKEHLGATITRSVGGKDFSDQRILR